MDLLHSHMRPLNAVEIQHLNTLTYIWLGKTTKVRFTCLIRLLILIGHLHIQVWSIEESLSITTFRCDLAIATHTRKMHK